MYTDISNKMEIKKYHTVGIYPKSKRQIVETEVKSIPPNIHMYVHCPGLK